MWYYGIVKKAHGMYYPNYYGDIETCIQKFKEYCEYSNTEWGYLIGNENGLIVYNYNNEIV